MENENQFLKTGSSLLAGSLCVDFTVHMKGVSAYLILLHLYIWLASLKPPISACWMCSRKMTALGIVGYRWQSLPCWPSDIESFFRNICQHKACLGVVCSLYVKSSSGCYSIHNFMLMKAIFIHNAIISKLHHF